MIPLHLKSRILLILETLNLIKILANIFGLLRIYVGLLIICGIFIGYLGKIIDNNGPNGTENPLNLSPMSDSSCAFLFEHRPIYKRDILHCH